MKCRQCGAPAPRHYVTTTGYVYAAFCSRECARLALPRTDHPAEMLPQDEADGTPTTCAECSNAIYTDAFTGCLVHGFDPALS